MEQLIQGYEGTELHRIVSRRTKPGGVYREVWVSTPINNNLFAVVHASRQIESLWLQVRANLTLFAGRYGVPVRVPGAHNDEQSHFARIDDVDEVWEHRTQIGMRAGVRIFGRFYKLDRFIGLTWGYKGDLLTPQAYDLAKAEFDREWQRLFPREPLLRGVHPDAYISRARPVSG